MSLDTHLTTEIRPSMSVVATELRLTLNGRGRAELESVLIDEIIGLGPIEKHLAGAKTILSQELFKSGFVGEMSEERIRGADKTADGCRAVHCRNGANARIGERASESLP